MQYEKLNHPNIIDFSHDPDGVWFGDPCYVVPNDQWGYFCDVMFAYEKQHEPGNHYIGEVTDEHSGFNWYCWNTAYGDGSYHLMVNHSSVAQLGVDAGMLAAIPMRLIKHWQKWGIISDCFSHGHVLEPGICTGELNTENGDMYFGQHITLPTGYDAEHNFEDEEEECVEEGYFLS